MAIEKGWTRGADRCYVDKTGRGSVRPSGSSWEGFVDGQRVGARSQLGIAQRLVDNVIATHKRGAAPLVIDAAPQPDALPQLVATVRELSPLVALTSTASPATRALLCKSASEISERLTRAGLLLGKAQQLADGLDTKAAIPLCSTLDELRALLLGSVR